MKQKAIVKKVVVVFWDAELLNGKKIKILSEDISKHNIIDGQIIEGEVVKKYSQDKYDNGEHARSYTITETFKIIK